MAVSFKAKYTSDCLGCDEQIDKGNMVTIMETPTGRVVVHLGCEENTPSAGPHRDGDRVCLADVMPRGKTAKDRCDRCFMIHSPGQQACE